MSPPENCAQSTQERDKVQISIVHIVRQLHPRLELAPDYVIRTVRLQVLKVREANLSRRRQPVVNAESHMCNSLDLVDNVQIVL